MFIRQLEYLIALEKYRHFAKAAESCFVSQPSLSVAIRQLEDELGLTIIQRQRRFLGFTPEGQRVLEWARKTLSSLDGLKQEAAFAQSVAGGHMTLGTVPSALRAVSRLAAEFRRAIPGLTLEIVSLSTREIQRRLVHQELHLGLAYSGEMEESLVSQPLYAERFVLVCGRKSSLLPRTTLSWQALAALPLCLLDSEMQNRRIIDEVFQQAGIVPNVVLETNNISLLYEMVQEGDLYSIMPISAIPAYLLNNSEMMIMPVTPFSTPQLNLLRLRQDNSPAVLEAVWQISQRLNIAQQFDEEAAAERYSLQLSGDINNELEG
ncbi:LysR family transcriptional regulator [Pantoea sp. A4]|uniref:LysR family transcriptional regulator n=1 Tax=Pantoea sp. A4 TaxID=1225184 RepID=UPI0003807C0A|nr:LysR family transcriptional regulator [Pantoea sp. A4]